MPKNKLQDVVLTAIMAIVMVYGMIVYNVAWNTGEVAGYTFLAALKELYIMAPIAFVLEFFIVGKLARKLAFTVCVLQIAHSLLLMQFRSAFVVSCALQ
jgi:hypothetical protein